MLRSALARPAIAFTGTVIAALALSACAPQAADADTTIAVDSGADTCTLSATEAAAGVVAFDITNSGEEETEFYLYGADGETIVSELEDLGPGATRTMVVEVEAGEYVTACKPGMTGDGIRGAFVVS